MNEEERESQLVDMGFRQGIFCNGKCRGGVVEDAEQMTIRK